MIKIIKQGTRRTKECENCGCIFSYDKEDIESYQNCYFLTCPQCNKEIPLEVMK